MSLKNFSEIFDYKIIKMITQIKSFAVNLCSLY